MIDSASPDLPSVEENKEVTTESGARDAEWRSEDSRAGAPWIRD